MSHLGRRLAGALDVMNELHVSLYVGAASCHIIRHKALALTTSLKCSRRCSCIAAVSTSRLIPRSLPQWLVGSRNCRARSHPAGLNRSSRPSLVIVEPLVPTRNANVGCPRPYCRVTISNRPFSAATKDGDAFACEVGHHNREHALIVMTRKESRAPPARLDPVEPGMRFDARRVIRLSILLLI